jgi:hypothetical protein
MSGAFPVPVGCRNTAARLRCRHGEQTMRQHHWREWGQAAVGLAVDVLPQEQGATLHLPTSTSAPSTAAPATPTAARPTVATRLLPRGGGQLPAQPSAVVQQRFEHHRSRLWHDLRQQHSLPRLRLGGRLLPRAVSAHAERITSTGIRSGQREHLRQHQRHDGKTQHVHTPQLMAAIRF